MRIIDVNYLTWNMETEALEEASPQGGDIIIPVHLYGNPCNMDKIMDIAEKAGAYVIEDACQAHGAIYKGSKVGAIGDAGVFSFFGNKILSCGEGGMITTNDNHIARRCRYLRGQALGPQRYQHDEIGFNFRITELQSAIGVGQVMLADNHLESRDDIEEMYKEKLKQCDIAFQWALPDTRPVAWLETINLSGNYHRDSIMQDMYNNGVETRPGFIPISEQRPYKGTPRYGGHSATTLSRNLLSLPTHASLTEQDVDVVCGTLIEAMSKWQM